MQKFPAPHQKYLQEHHQQQQHYHDICIIIHLDRPLGATAVALSPSCAFRPASPRSNAPPPQIDYFAFFTNVLFQVFQTLVLLLLIIFRFAFIFFLSVNIWMNYTFTIYIFFSLVLCIFFYPILNFASAKETYIYC